MYYDILQFPTKCQNQRNNHNVVIQVESHYKDFVFPICNLGQTLNSFFFFFVFIPIKSGHLGSQWDIHSMKKISIGIIPQPVQRQLLHSNSRDMYLQIRTAAILQRGMYTAECKRCPANEQLIQAISIIQNNLRVNQVNLYVSSQSWQILVKLHREGESSK